MMVEDSKSMIKAMNPYKGDGLANGRLWLTINYDDDKGDANHHANNGCDSSFRASFKRPLSFGLNHSTMF